MSRILIGKKIFKKNDQIEFLKSSLDYNQAHTFNKKLNQFKSKKTVVHGANILLYALEFLFNLRKIKIHNFSCNFLKPIFLNENIKFYFYKEDNENFIEIENNKNVICAKVFIKIEKSDNQKKIISKDNYIKVLRSKKITNIDPLSFLKKNFKIDLIKNKKFLKFPKITKMYGNFFCDALCSASYFVGMKCPGQKSIFTNISINLSALNKNCGYLLFNINHYEKKIRLFSINIEGFIKMNIKSIYLG